MAIDSYGTSDVDVVVVTYQSARHIEACLASIPSDATTIVVDNDSSDSSVEKASAAGAMVVVNSENRGFAAAANQGAALGSSPMILFLNPDAVLGEGALHRLVEGLSTQDTVGAVGPRLGRPDGTPARTLWPVPSPAVAWAETFGIHRFASRPRKGANFIVGTALLVRRRDFEQLGGFDETFWLYAEDADLGLRMARRGLRAQVIDEAVVTHVGGASGEASSTRTFEHFQLGGELLVHKHYGERGVALYRLAVLVGAALRVPLLALSPAARRDGRLAVRSATLRRSVRRLLRQGVRSRPVTAGPTLVVASLEAWDDVWRRNQFLVRELLTAQPNLRVLFVEPPYDVVIGLRRRTLPTRMGLRAVEGTDRVHTLRPLKLGPRVSGPWVDVLLHSQVLRAARRLGFADPWLWINDANYAGLLATGWPTLYDITDDWLEARATPRETARYCAREKLLLEKADEVVVCSAELARRKRARDVRIIPNAVDAEFFRYPRARPADLPAGPVAVYVGTLHSDRLDLELVARLAQEVPAAVVLVGPNALEACETERLKASGVHLLGAKPYSEVPAYLQHADVIVIPHAVNAFTESLDPIKTYECLAVGRPTLVTPVAGLRDAGPPIVVADAQSFVREAQRLLAAQSPSTAAAVPTWDERAAAFADALVHARQRCATRRRSQRA